MSVLDSPLFLFALDILQLFTSLFSVIGIFRLTACCVFIRGLIVGACTSVVFASAVDIRDTVVGLQR